MPYKCSLCDYTSNYKKDILKHFNKKKRCSDEEDILEVIEIQSNIICKICSKKLANNSSLARHLEACKRKQDNKKIKELEDKVTELSNKLTSVNINTNTNTNTTNNNTTNNTTNNNTTNNNTINNYITISLTPYNDPNMEGMQQYLEAALRKTFLSVPTLIESVHFNKEYPENQNICITNKRTKDAKVFDGKKWKTINKELLLNEIVDTYERELTNYAEEKGKTRFIKDYESAKKRGGGNAEKDLKDEVHNVIYDNSDKVNTKITEVQKPIKPEKEGSESESESEPESEPEINNESDSEPPPPDEYEEFRKQLDDSESESESET
jgi:hypothetical protein